MKRSRVTAGIPAGASTTWCRSASGASRAKRASARSLPSAAAAAPPTKKPSAARDQKFHARQASLLNAPRAGAPARRAALHCGSVSASTAAARSGGSSARSAGEAAGSLAHRPRSPRPVRRLSVHSWRHSSPSGPPGSARSAASAPS